MFEKAARMKLRFDYRGQISVEDLWDLPVEVLDKVYSSLRAGQKAFEEESLLKTVSQERSLVDLKIEIVKHIVEMKLKEKEARTNRALAKMQKEKIASIIEKKKDEGLESMSVEDLQKAMEELEV